MSEVDNNREQDWHVRAHDEWYSGFLLGASVMLIPFLTMLIVGRVL